MKELKEIFESVDSKLLENSSFSDKLTESIEGFINEKASQKADSMLKEKEEELIKAIDEQVKVVVESIEQDQKQKFNEAVEQKSKEISEEYCNHVKQESEKFMRNEVDTLQENMKKYLQHVVEEFVTEASPKWQEEIQVMKANKIMESFVGFTQQFGVQLHEITASDKVKDFNENYAKAIDKIEEQRKEISSLKREKVIKEKTEKLTSLQKDKINSLLESVEFSDEDTFSKKVDMYISAIGDSVKIVESNHKKQHSSSPSWKRS